MEWFKLLLKSDSNFRGEQRLFFVFFRIGLMRLMPIYIKFNTKKSRQAFKPRYNPYDMRATSSLFIIMLVWLLSVQTAFAIDGPPPPPPGHGYIPFNIRVFLQGFYDTNGIMNRANDHDGTTASERFPPPVAERIDVEIHTPGYYGQTGYMVVIEGVNLLEDGWATLDLPSEGAYYITIKTRNHVETVSMEPVNFAAETREYDFTVSANKAYGDNQIELEPGIFGMYAGDINQSGSVTIFDRADVIQALSLGQVGYTPEDLDGDGSITIFDRAMVINALSIGREAITPQ